MNSRILIRKNRTGHWKEKQRWATKARSHEKNKHLCNNFTVDAPTINIIYSSFIYIMHLLYACILTTQYPIVSIHYPYDISHITYPYYPTFPSLATFGPVSKTCPHSFFVFLLVGHIVSNKPTICEYKESKGTWHLYKSIVIASSTVWSKCINVLVVGNIFWRMASNPLLFHPIDPTLLPRFSWRLARQTTKFTLMRMNPIIFLLLFKVVALNVC